MKTILLSFLTLIHASWAMAESSRPMMEVDWSDVAIYAADVNDHYPGVNLHVMISSATNEKQVVVQIDQLVQSLDSASSLLPESLNHLKCNRPACNGLMQMKSLRSQSTERPLLCNHPACDGTIWLRD